MWLASVSLRKLGRIVPTQAYGEGKHRRAGQILDAILRGVGDQRWERAFRMCVTECRHRGLSDEEIAALPPSWKQAVARDLAGGPLEVFWSRGVPDTAISANPCHHPSKEPFPGGPSDLYLPLDCGACPPCVARMEIQRTGTPCGWECAT